MKKLEMLTPCRQWLAQHPRLVFGVSLLLFPVLTLIGMETIHRQDVWSTWHWVSGSSFEASLCLVLIFLFGGLFYAVAGSAPIGFGLAGLILLLASFVSQYKMSFLREPLLPWDLFLSKQGVNLLPYIYQGLGVLNLLTVLLFVGIGVLLWRVMPKFRLRLFYRLAVAGVVVAAFATLALHPKPLLGKLYSMGIHNYVFEQDINFLNNGFALGFAMNVGNVVIQEPEGYDQEAVNAVLATLETPAPNLKKKPSVQHPNIIFVMSEAFWDPTLLPHVKFSRDPLPNLHALMKKHTSGWLYSPTFGGDTANVEFEVLTGNSISFLPTGSIAYQQYVHAPMPSLASLYAEQGYQTVALHTYDKWFWKREQVYPYFGFQRFIGLSDIQDPAYNGEFVSDAEVTKTIKQLTEEAHGPLFLYTVTMQNHGPYTKPRYENTIKVEGDLSAESRAILETYAQGISDSDAQLKELIDHLQGVKEPTMLVFFGDHLPVLGETYRETDYLDDPSASATEAYTRQFTTPLLIWTNYGQKRQHIPGINASLLGARVLEMTNSKSTPYFDFLNRLSDQVPVLRKEMVMDAEGKMSAGVPEQWKELMEQYEILQYDLMFGKQYGRQRE